MDTKEKISDICDSLKELLQYKNEKYGNAALEPLNTFYKGNAQNGILIRLDDKLSRIKNSKEELRTNDIMDIMGYLVLLAISVGITKEDINNLKD